MTRPAAVSGGLQLISDRVSALDGPAINRQSAAQGGEAGRAFRQGFMIAEGEIAARAQALGHSVQHLGLKRRVEIGEDQVAAEDQIERSIGLAGADVLKPQRNIPAEGRVEAEQALRGVEGVGSGYV
jgi:hypothetical protein